MSFPTRLDAVRTVPLPSGAAWDAHCAAAGLLGSARASVADETCLGESNGQADGAATQSVAIVRHRVQRSYDRQAFPLPSDPTLAVGDHVLVEPDSCAIERRVATAPVPKPMAP